MLCGSCHTRSTLGPRYAARADHSTCTDCTQHTTRASRATRADAARGLTDIRRLADMLTRIQGRIEHRALDRVSPLAVPVMLEIGRETVYGEASDAMLENAAEALIAEAMD